MTGVQLNQFIRDENPGLSDDVVAQIIQLAKDSLAGVVFKFAGKTGAGYVSGRWCFDHKDVATVRSFVTDPKNILQAEKNASFFAGMSVASRQTGNSMSRFAKVGVIRFGSPGGNVVLDVDEAPAVFNQLTEEIQRLTNEIEALQSAKHEPQQPPSNVVTLRPAQAPVRPMTREGIVAALVDILVKNPEIYICSATKTEMGRKLSKMANNAGLRTLNGLKWSHKNLVGYERGIKEQFQRAQKPKVRATKDGIVVIHRPEFAFAIAAE